MKVKCERACELIGYGRVESDEILELEDGYAKVPIVEANFTVLEEPKNKDAPVVTEEALRTRAVNAYKALGTTKLVNALTNAGVYFEVNASASELAELALENFGPLKLAAKPVDEKDDAGDEPPNKQGE